MERLTSNKSVSEMGMVELAYNSCFVKDRAAWYRDYGVEVDARILARKLLKDFADGDDAFTCDEDFEEYITACLEDGTDSIEGLIALFYRNLWVMAGLREGLKYYENLEDKLNHRFCGCVSVEELVKSFVEFYDQQEKGVTADALLIVNENVLKYREWERLEEHGKLLKLPCAVGDTVWDNDFGKLCGYTVTGFSIGKIDDDEENDIDGLKMYYQNWNGSICCSCAVSEIGKTVFLTREEAEAALKEVSE